jgi:hypothetical protein
VARRRRNAGTSVLPEVGRLCFLVDAGVLACAAKRLQSDDRAIKLLLKRGFSITRIQHVIVVFVRSSRSSRGTRFRHCETHERFLQMATFLDGIGVPGAGAVDFSLQIFRVPSRYWTSAAANSICHPKHSVGTRWKHAKSSGLNVRRPVIRQICDHRLWTRTTFELRFPLPPPFARETLMHQPAVGKLDVDLCLHSAEALVVETLRTRHGCVARQIAADPQKRISVTQTKT